MNETLLERIEGRLPDTVSSTPATNGLIVLFWIVYAIEAIVLQRHGPELTMALFRVRPDHLEYVWTWVIAPFAHVSFAHVAINSYATFVTGGWAEESFGKRRYLGVFVVGGIATAVVGTLVVDAVSGQLLADLGIVDGATAAENLLGARVYGAAGGSMGIATVLGALLARDPTGRTTIVGLVSNRVGG